MFLFVLLCEWNRHCSGWKRFRVTHAHSLSLHSTTSRLATPTKECEYKNRVDASECRVRVILFLYPKLRQSQSITVRIHRSRDTSTNRSPPWPTSSILLQNVPNTVMEPLPACTVPCWQSYHQLKELGLSLIKSRHTFSVFQSSISAATSPSEALCLGSWC